MSAETDTPHDDAVFASEYALGLLEGEALLTARGKMTSDPAFAAMVTEWDDRLAPLLDDIAPMVPSSELWAKIEARIEARQSEQSAAHIADGLVTANNVIDLQARLKRWQWTAGLTSAAAVLALAFAAFGPANAPSPATPTPLIATADPLVAQVPIGETGLRLDVTYIPESEQMLIGAIGLTADGVHDHELWLVPADGSALQSLGVVMPGEVRRMELSGDITQNLDNGVKLLLTREPLGGKPEGVDAGPVVAEGVFSQV